MFSGHLLLSSLTNAESLLHRDIMFLFAKTHLMQREPCAEYCVLSHEHYTKGTTTRIVILS